MRLRLVIPWYTGTALCAKSRVSLYWHTSVYSDTIHRHMPNDHTTFLRFDINMANRLSGRRQRLRKLNLPWRHLLQ